MVDVEESKRVSMRMCHEVKSGRAADLGWAVLFTYSHRLGVYICCPDPVLLAQVLVGAKLE